MAWNWLRRRQRPAVDRTPCPHCGAMILETAIFCRHCGASDQSGWQPDTEGESLDDADEDFDYDEFVRREFPGEADSSRLDIRSVVIIVILLCFIVGIVLAF
ncbi:MAG: zinc ribbon domain-containing protein [Pirellulaceae bacterium]